MNQRKGKNEPHSSDLECPRCGGRGAGRETLFVCPECEHHFRIGPHERIDYLTDFGSFEEFGRDVESLNPIEMRGYEAKLEAAREKARMNDAVITGTAALKGRPVVMALMSFQFMGGSMGSVVGEKITRALERGLEEKKPVILYATSGGARMQEGIFSLMQMAKTSSAAAQLAEEGLPFFVVLCDPTTGGVTASFAMLGDVILAEPGALIGFAGPRVIEGTIRQKLPEGFQRAEFQLEKGFVDALVPRSAQRETLIFLIDTHCPAGVIPSPGGSSHES